MQIGIEQAHDARVWGHYRPLLGSVPPGPCILSAGACTFARMAGHKSQEAQEADLVARVGVVGPGHVHVAIAAALLPGHARPEDHGAFGFLPLLQPADPLCVEEAGRENRAQEPAALRRSKG